MEEFDHAHSDTDDKSKVLRRLFAAQRDALEAFDATDALFDACSRLIERFGEELRNRSRNCRKARRSSRRGTLSTHYWKNLPVPRNHTARGAHHHLLVAMW